MNGECIFLSVQRLYHAYSCWFLQHLYHAYSCWFLFSGSCGGEVSIGLQSNTTILSPNYPSNYIDNINCKWIISAPENTRVRISFSNFATESRYDTVELCSDQFCDTSTRLTTLSGQLGTSMREYNSSSNVLLVELNTDGRVSSSGFRATVTAIEILMPPTGMYSTIFVHLQ